MDLFLEECTTSELIKILNRLKNNRYENNWEKRDLIYEILGYGSHRYTEVLTITQLKAGLEFHSLSKKGKKAILRERLLGFLMMIDGSTTVNPPPPNTYRN